MTTREVLNSVMAHLGLSQAKFAEKIGWGQPIISQRLARESLRANELFDLMEANGIEVLFRDKATGEILNILTPMTPGHGRRLKGMDNRIKFDTGLSSAISNTFYADGVHEYDENGEAQELYLDIKGRYFFAEYHESEHEKDRIVLVPKSVAEAFAKQYGREIEKQKI